MNDNDSIPTRQSLLARLKDLGDQQSWWEFFETYWRLIHATAFKAGLSEAECQEVVQEVMIAAAKKLPEFTYQPGKDSLKGWLLALARWKVGDQFRKRQSKNAIPDALAAKVVELRPAPMEEDTARTATVERVPDSPQFEAIWDAEWRENLLRTGLGRVKHRVNPAHYEIYHLHVLQGLSVQETVRVLDTNFAAVYLAKHRVGKVLRAEIKRLETEIP